MQKSTAKMQHARKRQEQGYQTERQQLRDTDTFEPVACDCKLDKVVIASSAAPTAAIHGIPGFRLLRRYPVKQEHPGDFTPYGWVARVAGTSSIREVVIYSDRQAKWLAPARVVVIARDGKVGYGYKSMKNLFGHIRAVYNFYRDETAQQGKPGIGEWFVKWKRIAPPKPIEEEQPAFGASVTSAIVNKARTQLERALYATSYGIAGRGGEVFGLHVPDVREQSNATGIVCIRRSVFEGLENNTKSSKTRYVPIDASVMEEIKKHLAGRTAGYVFQTRNGTPLRLSNVLEDWLHPILDEFGLPRTGMHAFRRGRISDWVYSGVSRQVIRDWAGHGSDKLVDLYTKKMWQYHSPEMSKVKPLELDSSDGERRVEPVSNLL